MWLLTSTKGLGTVAGVLVYGISHVQRPRGEDLLSPPSCHPQTTI